VVKLVFNVYVRGWEGIYGPPAPVPITSSESAIGEPLGFYNSNSEPVFAKKAKR